jgi:hypothetical protein
MPKKIVRGQAFRGNTEKIAAEFENEKCPEFL